MTTSCDSDGLVFISSTSTKSGSFLIYSWYPDTITNCYIEMKTTSLNYKWINRVLFLCNKFKTSLQYLLLNSKAFSWNDFYTHDPSYKHIYVLILGTGPLSKWNGLGPSIKDSTQTNYTGILTMVFFTMKLHIISIWTHDSLFLNP